MTASLTIDGFRYALRQIAPSRMDWILQHPDTKELSGKPIYFDLYRRVWPAPINESIVVEFCE